MINITDIVTNVRRINNNVVKCLDNRVKQQLESLYYRAQSSF